MMRAWRGADWARDTKRVVRRLVRAPVFLLAMVGTLTVGLGAFAVVHTVVRQVLIAPLPYEDADDLYYVWRDYGWFDLDRGWVAGTDVAELQEAAPIIEEAVALQRGQATISGDATTEPREIGLISSSPGFFELLRAQPMLGRGFAPEEFGPDRPLVLVLGHDLWRGHFGADPGVVGAEIRLNGNPATVIGVMGPDFRFVRHSSLGPPRGGDAYISMNVNLAETNPGAGSYAGLIRARRGAAPEAVESAVAAVGARIDERDFDNRGLRLYPVGKKADLIAPVRPAVVALGAAGAFLLLVLLVNLSTLLLSRAAQREREFAVSRALGANGFVIARTTLLEGGILGLLGGAGGALVALWGTRLLAGIAPADLPRREAIAMDPAGILTIIAIGALLGVLAGALPAIWSSRTRLAALLSAAAVRGGGGHGRLRRGMVVVQVALSLVLLSAGGLVVRSFDHLLRAHPGFDPDGVLTMRIAVPLGIYADNVPALHERIENALAGVPGVTHTAATTALPLTPGTSQTPVNAPGAPGNRGDADHDNPLVDRIWIRPGYFAALGIRFLEGADLDAVPPEGVQQVVIDRTLAERFHPAGGAAGTTIRVGENELRVVGVVEHVRHYDMHADGRPQIYVRNGEGALISSLSWVVRTPRPAAPVYSEIRRALHAGDPEIALTDMRPMREIVSGAVSEQRLSATLIGGFSLGALMLAAMGLFGVVAGSVTRRRHEIAVRLALGADHPRVLRLVAGEGAILVLLGLLVGAPGIYFSGRVVRGIIVGVSPFDPLTLGAVAAGLAATALLACYLPARRVMRIAPAQSLRQE
jgi:putative ABC transport system permease protein